MLRRFLFTSLALALVAQPAFAQAPDFDTPVVAESSASDSDDGRDSKKAAFALGTVGAGVALGVASSLSSDAAPAFDYSAPTSDASGGADGLTGPQTVPVPEPGTLPLMLAGLAGLAGLVVLRRREATAV